MNFDIVSFSAYFSLVFKYTIGASIVALVGLWLTGHLGKTINAVYEFESDDEQRKFTMLSVCGGLIIGVYWMFRASKEAVFFELVPKHYLPRAKILTTFLMFGVLFVFNLLVDRIKKHRIFAATCLTYAAIFTMIAISMKIGFPEVNHPLVNWIPGRALGWIYWFSVETMGSLMVGAVFWAFVASTTKTASAKRGYPMIGLLMQVGFLLGTSSVVALTIVLGRANFMLVGVAILTFIPVLMEIYMKVIPAHLHESDDSGAVKKPKTGVFEGLRLIATKPFLLGVAVVSTVYEVVTTILDCQFKFLGADFFPVPDHLAAFNGLAATCIALFGILVALLGTKAVIKKLGVKFGLLLYPALLGLVVVGVWSSPGLITFLVALVVAKSLSYTFNNPIKELLYLPTSKDVKMKAKGFIDGFGGKFSKSAGSVVTDTYKSSMSDLLTYGSMVSLGVIGGWLIVALFVGSYYDKLIKDKKILE